MVQPDIELEDLTQRRPPPPQPRSAASAQPAVEPPNADESQVDGVMSAWAWTSATLVALLASLLTLFPRFLLFAGASSAEVERRNVLTPLESFIAVQFGIFLYAVALVLLLYVPSPSPIEQELRGTRWHPLLGSLSIASCISAFVAYNTDDVGPLSLFVFMGNTIIGGFGLWTMAFGGSSRISHKTGADKRTSRFLFGNRAAASAQKKRWKEEQKKAL